MPITFKTLKVPVGMRRSLFGVIATEPAAAHPTYNAPVSMGEAVKGEMSVTTASASIYGDDVDLLEVEEFVNAQVDVETACDDLETNALIFGHTYATTGDSANVELSGMDDAPPLGGYGYIQHLIKKDKSHAYRGVFFFKVSAMPSSEKQSDKTKASSLDPTMNPVSFKIFTDNTGKWRARKEFTTQADADAWLASMFGTT